jgi:hypothetical protein
MACPEQFGPEPFGLELTAERLTAEGPKGLSSENLPSCLLTESQLFC